MVCTRVNRTDILTRTYSNCQALRIHYKAVCEGTCCTVLTTLNIILISLYKCAILRSYCVSLYKDHQCESGFVT